MKPVSQVLESLLSGSFICPATDREAYKTLKEDRTRREIDTALSIMGRELHCTSRTSAYYVTHKVIGDHNRSQVKNLVANVHSIIRPVVKFIATVSEAAQVESVIVGGDELSVPTLAAQIQASPSLIDKLDGIYRFPKVKRNKNRETAPDKLDVVVDFLAKEGLAHLVNKERQLYVMTGKVDFIYELLEFIDTHESITETVNKTNDNQGEFDF